MTETISRVFARLSAAKTSLGVATTDIRKTLSKLQARAVLQLLAQTSAEAHADDVAACADLVMEIQFDPEDTVQLLEALASYGKPVATKVSCAADDNTGVTAVAGGVGSAGIAKIEGAIGNADSTVVADAVGEASAAKDRRPLQHYCPSLCSHFTKSE